MGAVIGDAEVEMTGGIKFDFSLLKSLLQLKAKPKQIARRGRERFIVNSLYKKTISKI